MCAELMKEMRIRTWGNVRDRQIRSCYIALQLRRTRICPYTPQDHIMLPTKLPFLSKIGLTTDVFFKILGDFSPEQKPVRSSKHANTQYSNTIFFLVFSPRDADKISSAYCLLLVNCCRLYSRRLNSTADPWCRGRILRPALRCGGRFGVVWVRGSYSISRRFEGLHGACRVESGREDP